MNKLQSKVSVFIRKRKLVILSCVTIAFLLVLSLGSCATGLPKPTDSSDSLLIISVDTQIPLSAPAGLSSNYIMKVKGIKNTITIKPGRPFIFAPNLPPGEHVTVQLQEKVIVVGGSWARGGGKGLQPPEPFTVPFQLKPGFITIFPVKFTFIIKQPRSHSYTYAGLRQSPLNSLS